VPLVVAVIVAAALPAVDRLRRPPYGRPRRRLRKNSTTRTMMMISSSVLSRMAPPLCRVRLPGRTGA
jgi:hypothetical protein